MRKAYVRLAHVLHRLTRGLCIASLLLVLVSMTANVLLRHGMSVGFLKMQDLTLFAFAAFAILSIPLAVAERRHVRVDLTRAGDTKSTGSGSALFGLGVCLLPLSALLFLGSVPQFLSSVRILEGSGQIGGLGGFFIIKGLLPLAALLIAVQGVAAFLQGNQYKPAKPRAGK